MSDVLAPFTAAAGAGGAVLPARFDAERDTPDVFAALSSRCPAMPEIMASLRRSVPLAPHAQPGRLGHFYRIPNHYRSISLMVPESAPHDSGATNAVIVFKGTEPLLPDFPRYLDWMLRAPFRSSALPMALHFALEMKLPPAAMWIEECLMEQEISSRIQLDYLRHYGRLARLPVPLFVYELTREHVRQYETLLRHRLTAAAFKRIEAKVADGLGIEVYYYPSLPVRAADLFVRDIKEAFGAALTVESLEPVFVAWIRLLYETLHLGYMPYAPWNQGMGACVDPGNACLDGGFNDLLTLVPCDSVPTEPLFRRSLYTSMQLLANSIAAVCSVASGTRPSTQPDSSGTPFAFVVERLRAHHRQEPCRGHSVDARLTGFFEVPTVGDVIDHLRELQRDREEQAQFVSSHAGADAPDLRFVNA